MREIEYAANYAIANYSQEQQPQLESQNLNPGNSCQRLGNLRILHMTEKGSKSKRV